MNERDGNPLHILVIAASSERRSSLAGIIGRAVRVRITPSASVSLPGTFLQQLAAELVLVDVDSPTLADAVVGMAESLPEGVGLITLADDPATPWAAAALRAGVNAILSRDATGEEIKLAILAAEADLVLLHPSSAQDLGQQLLLRGYGSSVMVEALTAREQEVLQLASEGLGNKEIATRLKISDHTVKFHISSILGKLGAGSRTEAVSQGIRRGLIAI